MVEKEWMQVQVVAGFEDVMSVLVLEFVEEPRMMLLLVESPTGSSYHRRWLLSL